MGFNSGFKGLNYMNIEKIRGNKTPNVP